MATIWSERSLHTPMYLFLWALSISEILYTLAIIPHMLADMLCPTAPSPSWPVPARCSFLSHLASPSPSYSLSWAMTAMWPSVNHCYNVLMSPRGCACLVAWSWVVGSMMGIVVTTAIFNLTFCGPNDIHHFVCHVLPLLKLACQKDVLVVAKGVGLVCVSALLGCLLLILLSYAFIVTSLWRIPSAEGWHKAFSTCASHLTVVIVHYGFASVI
jgi:olfactory receptor